MKGICVIESLAGGDLIIPEDYAFEKIPDGFTYESGVLEYFIQSEEPYDFLYERLNMCKKLYEWATQLPECSKQR